MPSPSPYNAVCVCCNRFVGVACVDLADPVRAVEALDKAVTEYGFKALRVVGKITPSPSVL